MSLMSTVLLIPVPKGRLDDYKKLARLCEQVWREYGAIGYVECVGDDVPTGTTTSFPAPCRRRGRSDHLFLDRI